ncbi:YopX family protein [Enterococcus gallinarum]|uniref:YopX family protein n=1 Tax=Enterococcus gallinarum TaxID=1353 RepID=UPI0022E02742|nr:YopX family protein [Enterococcus gallinarum]
MYIKPKFKVLDLYNGVVIDSDETPVVNGTLNEVLRQFQGQTYDIIQSTGFNDFNGVEIYDKDYLIVYRFGKDLKRIKIAEGRVKMGIFGTCVDVLDSDNGKIKTYYLSDGKLDFKKIGDYFYQK